MKLTVWIRPGSNERDIVMRTDYKLESADSPVIQRYGFKLLAAIEEGTDDGADGAKEAK